MAFSFSQQFPTAMEMHLDKSTPHPVMDTLTPCVLGRGVSGSKGPERRLITFWKNSQTLVTPPSAKGAVVFVKVCGRSALLAWGGEEVNLRWAASVIEPRRRHCSPIMTCNCQRGPTSLMDANGAITTMRTKKANAGSETVPGLSCNGLLFACHRQRGV